MRGRNWKGWWDSQATPCFLPTSLLGTGWEVTGDTDPNPNSGGHYRGLLNQAHNTCQFPGWCINAWSTQAAPPILPQLRALESRISAKVKSSWARDLCCSRLLQRDGVGRSLWEGAGRGGPTLTSCPYLPTPRHRLQRLTLPC